MRFVLKPIVAAALITTSFAAMASSHREAPLIAGMPRVDGTDFYMFRSYEPGRADYTTLIANYAPLQNPGDGPNYFKLDPSAVYEIHIDNNGDSAEDLTFQFKFTNTYKGLAVPTGAPANVAVPLNNIGPIDATGANLNVVETYTLNLIRGNRRTGTSSAVADASSGSTTFPKPSDNIGNKSIPDYATYANGFIKNITIPGCTGTGRVFAGQRHEGFVVNIGQLFDLVNLNPLGARDSGSNAIYEKNVTSLAIEVPTACLVAGTDPVIGAWTTASLPQSRVFNPSPTGPVTSSAGKGPLVDGGAYTQVSRVGAPLVNEVIIGLTDKDKFNASEPKNDLASFGTYVQYPTLPVLVNALFKVPVPAVPRTDLVAAFVTGITATVNGSAFKFTAPAAQTVPGEMLRLNTSIAPAAPADQKDLGFLACDLAGFPNGRRPVDDVVDIELTVAEGAITTANVNNLQTCDVSGATPVVKNAGAVVNDGALPIPTSYLTVFPYLNTPLPGAVSPETQATARHTGASQ